MTVEVIVSTVSAAFAALTGLFGGNLFNKYMTHAKELAVTQYKLAEAEKRLEKLVNDVVTLQSDSKVVSMKIDEFVRHIAKLETIPSLDAKLDATIDLVKSMQEIVLSIAKERLSNN